LVLALVCLAVVSCKKDIEGCTDPMANNYDENATKDDGSCIYSNPSQSNLNGKWYFVSWKEVDGWNQNMQSEIDYDNILDDCDLNSYAEINGNILELKTYSDNCSSNCPLNYESIFSISFNDSTINFSYDSFTDLINCNNSNPNSDSYEVEFYINDIYRYIKTGNTLKLYYNNSDSPQELWTDIIILEKNDASSNFYGCTDPLAINYNPNATIDDGSCQYSLIDTIFLNSSVFAFVLNEVLYDPPSGIDGDANSDGIRDPNEDEFVEFVNTTSSCIDISGCKIFDDDSYASLTHKHQFSNNTFVNPNQAVVVFGGPQGSSFNPSSFGNSLVFAASEAVMNLNNSGDKMYLTDSLNNIIIEFDINPLSESPNESYTRNPDLTGGFEQHSNVSGTLFSPGKRADGSSF
jgi:hypothetical protein